MVSNPLSAFELSGYLHDMYIRTGATLRLERGRSHHQQHTGHLIRIGCLVQLVPTNPKNISLQSDTNNILQFSKLLQTQLDRTQSIRPWFKTLLNDSKNSPITLCGSGGSSLARLAILCRGMLSTSKPGVQKTSAK